jgi:allantoinase
MAQPTNRNLKVFRSTRVVTPQGLLPAAIVVRGGRIQEISGWQALPSDAELIDAGEAVLLPGLVDSHVHINDAEPGPDGLSRSNWEGFSTATQAAAAGGVTTLVDMPLNCVPETITVDALEAKRAAAAGNVWVDWMSWGGAVGNNGIGGNEHELAGLIEAGVPGFKCFLVHSGIDGFRWVDESQLRKTLGVLSGRNLPLLAHAEVAGPVEQATAKLADQDWRSYATYLASRPDEAELEAIALLIRLAGEFDVPIHIVHVASAEALPMLKQAREAELRITAETCPQYLWFAGEEIPDGATEFKCAPPIRSAANREGLWQGLLDGVLDLVATDHSPCPPALKNRGEGRFDRAWGGIASLGLALPVMWTGLQSRGGDLNLLAKWLSAEPARLAGVTGQKGALAAGFDADIVVFDPDAEWTVTEADLRFRHKVSPYLGARLNGRVLQTWLRGELIFSADGTLDPIETKPAGRELRRTL